MTAVRYIEQVLEGAWGPFYEEVRKERGGIIFLQQDGASPHRAKVTQAWLRMRKIPIFPHPPNSPDLSPIEAIWHLLKKRLRALPRLPTSSQELKDTVRRLWDEITVEEIDAQIRTMPERVQAVLAAKRGHTKY